MPLLWSGRFFDAGAVAGGGGSAGPTPTYRHHNATLAAGVSSVDVAYPTGLAADDILVLFAIYDPVGGTSVSWNMPTGFTRIGTEKTLSEGSKTGVFWKRADGTEAGNLTVTLNGTMAGGRHLDVILAAYSGCLTGADPVDDFSEVATDIVASTTAATMGTITTTGDNRRVICGFLMGADGGRKAGDGGPATGWTQRGDHGSSAGFDGGAAFDDIEQAGAGSPVNDFYLSVENMPAGVHAFALKPNPA